MSFKLKLSNQQFFIKNVFINKPFCPPNQFSETLQCVLLQYYAYLGTYAPIQCLYGGRVESINAHQIEINIITNA